MLVLRFMSANEALTLVQDKPAINNHHHKALGSNSSSIGACFHVCSQNKPGMYDAAKYLSGIATLEVCLVGTLHEPLPRNFKRTYGRYAEGMQPELSAKRYSLKDFDDWALYTPEPIPYDQNFKIISSINWLEPVLTRSSKDGH